MQKQTTNLRLVRITQPMIGVTFPTIWKLQQIRYLLEIYFFVHFWIAYIHVSTVIVNYSDCKLFVQSLQPVIWIFYPPYLDSIIYVRSWSLVSWYTEMPSEQPNSPASSSVVCLLTCDCCVLSLLDIWRCCPGLGWGLGNLSNTTLSISLSLL